MLRDDLTARRGLVTFSAVRAYSLAFEQRVTHLYGDIGILDTSLTFHTH